MKKSKILVSLASLLMVLSANAATRAQETEIPRTAYKDIYKYYILEVTRNATIYQVTYKRLGYDTILYGKVEINCPSKYIRSMGTNVRSVKDINTANPTQWTRPTIGSIELDLITYVCR